MTERWRDLGYEGHRFLKHKINNDIRVLDVCVTNYISSTNDLYKLIYLFTGKFSFVQYKYKKLSLIISLTHKLM